MTTTWSRTRIAAVLGVAATALTGVLAACGGGDDETSESPEVSDAREASEAPEASGEHTTTAGGALPVAVDTDLAADDLVALLYLASDPDVELVAVTVSGTGEVRCPRGVEVARSLLLVTGDGDVPVACGQSTPLQGDRVFPLEWRDGADAAYGLSLPPAAAAIDDRDAVELLTDTIGNAPAPVTLLTLGPLTNVALAFAAEPDLVEELTEIVIMGGAVDVPGNVQPEAAAEPLAAEWNLYIDPQATADVIGSGAMITLVSLDATNQVPVSAELVERIEANATTDAAGLVARLLGQTAPPYLWDTLAAIATARPDLVARRERPIAVVTEGDDAGATVEQADGSPVRVADPPDTAAVFDELIRTLAGLAEDEPLVTPTTLPVVGEASVSFDGEVCAYDGPTSLPLGALRVTQVTGSVDYLVVVGHLVAGATIDEAAAWQTQHPGEQPPMVDSAIAIGTIEGVLPSPAVVELLEGDNPVVCGTIDGNIVVGAVVTAG